MAFSDEDIRNAFYAGDGDKDDGLSVTEAVDALRCLTNKTTVDDVAVENACTACSIDTSREMTVDEFVAIVRYLQSYDQL